MFQEITIIGNIGNTPEMRYTPGGQAVTNFNLATNRKYKGAGGEEVKETVWFRISCWGKQAEIANTYLGVGSQVAVKGRLKADPATGGPRVYNAQDGSARASFEVDCKELIFIKLEGGRGPSGNEQNEDIPF